MNRIYKYEKKYTSVSECISECTKVSVCTCESDRTGMGECISVNVHVRVSIRFG